MRPALILLFALLLALSPGTALAQTTPTALASQLGSALQRVNAGDAAGSRAAVEMADKMFGEVEKVLERQDLAAERQVENGIDAAREALAANPPNFGEAARQLSAARAALQVFLGPAGAPGLPRAGAPSTALARLVALAVAPLAAGLWLRRRLAPTAA